VPLRGNHAYASTVVCAACLDLLFIKKRASEADLEVGKKRLSRLVALLVGLIKSKSPERFGRPEE